MFGFGKKTLDDNSLRHIIIEMQMFQSWTLDYRNTDLSMSDLNYIAKAIFDRENLKHDNNHINFATMACIAQDDYSEIKKLRLKTNFDQQITGFCRSIGLSQIYYSPSK